MEENTKERLKREIIGANYLTSVYGRENFMNFIKKNFTADFVLYANKEKIQDLERLSKLPLFGDYFKNLEFNKIIHQSYNVCNIRTDNC